MLAIIKLYILVPLAIAVTESSIMSHIDPETRYAVSCAIWGMVGGAIYQGFTYDDRLPTFKYFVSEMAASGVMGFAIFAISGTQSMLIVLAAIAAGATGNAGWLRFIEKFKPDWAPQRTGEE